MKFRSGKVPPPKCLHLIISRSQDSPGRTSAGSRTCQVWLIETEMIPWPSTGWTSQLKLAMPLLPTQVLLTRKCSLMTPLNLDLQFVFVAGGCHESSLSPWCASLARKTIWSSSGPQTIKKHHLTGKQGNTATRLSASFRLLMQVARIC